MKTNALGWSLGVVVPAQNEEDSIAACIQSILESHRAAHMPATLWIVVVADACSDRTAERARTALGPHGVVIEIDARSAGSARRAGADTALAHFAQCPTQSIWLANTDADTVVCSDWIDVQLGFADQGVTGIAGIVKLDEGGCAEAHELFGATYLMSPDGSHGHVHGANMAMRADAYIDAGGWSDTPLAEDHCLWGRMRSRGWNLLSTVASVVVTSARLEGRARGGFADTLKAGIDARRDIEAHHAHS